MYVVHTALYNYKKKQKMRARHGSTTTFTIPKNMHYMNKLDRFDVMTSLKSNSNIELVIVIVLVIVDLLARLDSVSESCWFLGSS